MEEPNVTIKQENVDNFIVATEPNIKNESQLLDMEIKVEPIKIEPCPYEYEPNYTDQNVKLSEDKGIGSSDSGMLASVSLSSLKLVLQRKLKKGATEKSEKKTFYGGSEKIQCNLCHFKTFCKYSLNLHMNRHINPDDDDSYKCDQCDYKTVYKTTFQRHVLKHKNPDEVKMYKCDQCHYQTLYRQYLKSHLLKHKNRDDDDPYKCEQCNFKTVYYKIFKFHMFKHKNPGNISCSSVVLM